MQVIVRYAIWMFVLISPTYLVAQSGKDGSETVATSGVVFNRYDVLNVSIASGSNTATVANIANLAGGAAGPNNPYATSVLRYGDLILVIKMQGASINTTNSASYGAITALNGAGNYELAVVRGVTGNTITICNTFANAYTVSSTQRVQVVRIPRVTTLTVNAGASLTAPAWNGTTGAVVAVEANGNIVVNGVITASGLGFRGGAYDNNSNLPGNGSLVSTSSLEGGEKGESIAGSQTDYDALGGRYNRGAPANGGGGGNAHNAGGGGGANAGALTWTGTGNPDITGTNWSSAWNLEGAGFSSSTSSGGGRGGYTYGANNLDAITQGPGNAAWGGDGRQNLGGLGGRPVTYSANTMFMGGGGGAGDANNNAGATGGNGGGIILLSTTASLSGTGSIVASGASAPNTTGGHNDAPGGGGGGGAVRLNVQGTISSITVTASGGNGGSQLITSAENEGPGGGGGGGHISVPGAPAITITRTGGTHGTTSSSAVTEFTPNGATRGGAGVLLNNQSFVASPALSCFALPVHFVSFNAVLLASGKVQVSWITANEENIDHFKVEVNTGGQQWKAVAQTQPSGQATNTYTELIEAHNSPFYVRVTSVDADGRIQYSPVVVVKSAEGQPRLIISGNNLKIDRLPADLKEIVIYSASGQEYKRQALTSSLSSASLNISVLPAGVYYVHLIANGEEHRLKFVK